MNLSISKIKSLTPQEIEEQLAEAAVEQVDKKDCSLLAEFLQPDFAVQRFAEWARAKFDIPWRSSSCKDLRPSRCGSCCWSRRRPSIAAGRSNTRSSSR